MLMLASLHKLRKEGGFSKLMTWPETDMRVPITPASVTHTCPKRDFTTGDVRHKNSV